MKNFIKIVSPIKKPEDVDFLAKQTSCRSFYVYHHKFLNNNFEYINCFIEHAKKQNCNIFVNFKHNIKDDSIFEVEQFISFLKSTQITGVLVNNFKVLEILKRIEPDFEIVIDSYFDIHNLAGIEFSKLFGNINKFIITEEIYIKNLEKIKKYFPNISISIDSDNISYFACELEKTNIIDNVVIKGKFSDSFEILKAIKFVENVINEPSKFVNEKLPFKHIRKSIYQANHFSGEIISLEGEDFKFSRNIKNFNWNIAQTELLGNIDFSNIKIPNLTVRLSSLEQLNNLNSFKEKNGISPVKTIEYGEIANTLDLSQKSFKQIMQVVKKFSFENNINLAISTPRILIERDFERVYDYIKELLLEEPRPFSVVANNIGLLNTMFNDADLKNLKIELGDGIGILNAFSVLTIEKFHKINGVDFSNLHNFEDLEACLKYLKGKKFAKKIIIAGNMRIPTLGLCPLNNKSAVVSRLSCKAPCHKGNFALYDPCIKKTFPFVTDGFCRMHMYKDEPLNNFDKMKKLQQIGINDFIIDLNTFQGAYVSTFLSMFLNSLI